MFKGEKVILRSYEKKDIDRAHALFNDYETRSFLDPGVILPMSHEEEEKFIELCRSNKEKGYNFAIETLEGEYIGGCGYFGLETKNRHTYIGIAIVDKKYWGRGYGTDAMKVLINFLFNELNIHKILLKVYSYNKRGIACYKKLGFIEEGYLREQIFRDGSYHDEMIMSLFRQQYNQKKS